MDVHDVIQVHRRHLIELMQRYTTVKADAAEDDVALALVVDAELFRIEGASGGSTARGAVAPASAAGHHRRRDHQREPSRAGGCLDPPFPRNLEVQS